jgi:phosphatidylglycerol:prolipoprotein diacylglycerol transferase
VASQEAKRRGLDPEVIWDALFWVVLAGIVGARIWHVFTPPSSMLVLDPASGKMVNPYFVGGYPHILDMIDIRRGGLGIFGAVIGGALAFYIYCRNKKLSFLTWVDLIAPGLALAQAIGRWGNFFNQELYGAPTNLPWKLYIDPAHRLPAYSTVAYYHPLFAYEFIWNLANAAVLIWLGRKFQDRLKPGDIFTVYLIIYPVGRFLFEFLRLDPGQINGVNINQIIMAFIYVFAAAFLIYRHKFAPSN